MQPWSSHLMQYSSEYLIHAWLSESSRHTFAWQGLLRFDSSKEHLISYEKYIGEESKFIITIYKIIWIVRAFRLVYKCVFIAL